MKRMWNKLRRGEKGQALMLVLILMLVGGLIIAPLLAYVGTGLKIGKDVHEERMDELYAADAGVEDGLWYLQDIERLKSLIEDLTGGTPLPEEWIPEDYLSWPLPSYNLGDDINGKRVDVTMDYIPYDNYNKYFKITSKATSYDDSSTTISSTTINSYNQILPFFNLLDNAITSRSTVNLKPGTEVCDGDVVYCEDPPPPQDQVIGGEVRQDCAVAWPPADLLSEFYLGDVEGSDFNSDTIDVKDTHTIEPLYRNGDLTIINTNNTGLPGDPINTITLDGTIYVTGKLTIGTTKQAFTLNLNGKTIFVSNNSTDPKYAIDVRGGNNGCTLTGSGCIIAVGDINLNPNMNSTPDDFVFVMSIDGKVWFKPNGDFYGSIAGDVKIELWPGGTFTWVPWENQGLNFPSANPASWIPPRITTWEIKLN